MFDRPFLLPLLLRLCGLVAALGSLAPIYGGLRFVLRPDFALAVLTAGPGIELVAVAAWIGVFGLGMLMLAAAHIIRAMHV